MRSLLLLVAISLVPVAGCKKHRAGPSKRSIIVRFDRADVAGATVTVAGQREPLETKGELPWAVLSFDQLPPPPATVQLELATPCGPAQLDVPVRVSDQFERSYKLNAQLALPKATPLWVAAPPGTVVGIGALTVTVPPATEVPRWDVHGLDCAPSHAVTVGGAAAGTVDAQGKGGIFVTAAKDECYSVEIKGYGAAGGTGGPTLLRDANVYRLPTQIDHFLGKAPSRVSVDRGTKEDYRAQLTRVPCP